MTFTLGRWEIRTDRSKDPACDAVRICRSGVTDLVVPANVSDLDQAAGDFITRHVLERDSDFFDG